MAPGPADPSADANPAGATATEPPAVPDAPASPSASGASALTAESLFSRANQARRRGDDAGAIRLYRELRDRFPESRESAVAGPILGQLLLDKGSAEGALSEFDRYLDRDRGGTVTEEALVGRANALMRLGKRAEERAAWQTLLDRYPGTVHAGRARQRLAELR
jgi:TolA-binding protein